MLFLWFYIVFTLSPIFPPQLASSQYAYIQLPIIVENPRRVVTPCHAYHFCEDARSL